jgi:hypothetical protein
MEFVLLHNAYVHCYEPVQSEKSIDEPKLTTVDQKTFELLSLAERAICYTKQVLPKGSPNQLEHVGGSWDKRLDHDNIYLNYLTMGPEQQLAKALQENERDCDDDTYAKLYIGLGAGIARYYGGGNCSFHNRIAINFLLKNAPLGTRITLCHLTTRDHCLTLIEFPGLNKVVVCDPHPANHPQAVLLEHYVEPKENMTLQFSTVVDNNTRGIDFMERFYSLPWVKDLVRSCDYFKKVETLTEREKRQVQSDSAKYEFKPFVTTRHGEIHEYCCSESGTHFNSLSEYRTILSQGSMPECANPIRQVHGKRSSTVS